MLLTGKDNPQIKHWRLLSVDGRARRREHLFACEGARLCADAVSSGLTVETLLYTRRAAETYASLLQPVLDAAAGVFTITDQLARQMADTTSPQGIFCICRMPDRIDDMMDNGTYLALEDVQDPANIGAIIRTAEALGLSGLVFSSGCCDIYNPKVLRASMGGIFRLPILSVADLPTAIAQWRSAGLRCYAAVPDGTAVPLTEVSFSGGTVFCVGNEGNGLRPQTIAACDESVTIPMAGRAESLNAAMAAGILIWEMKRR